MALDASDVEAVMELAIAHERVLRADEKLMLAPLARLALSADYSRTCAHLRANPAFGAAVERFEVVNRDLKALMTDWQTRSVAGATLPNDHTDTAYDNGIIDRLGRFHDRVEALLDEFVALVPRLAYYRDGLLAALERSEDGEIAFVSDVGCESYHTLWFDLHEELLRLSGTERVE
ncbi:MAG: hypothetical protein JJ970_07675 [Erythrobacter sp.]|uniref:hypothetical protein n=1 Tax=Erythrobacter sp. TaxID=1042 RepID=UPI001B1667D0|nr:hypothetical protein [Erythrobacter sp.]MBO6529903.1 hypothetical protein [Erythrobacter sp.]